jgi:hypothetical protein
LFRPWFCLKLTPEAINLIELIITGGKDARVTPSKDGFAVYQESKKKVYPKTNVSLAES